MAKKDYSLDKEPANKQRLVEYVQDDQWIIDFLKETKIGHIATRWENQPFITPNTFYFDEDRKEIMDFVALQNRHRTPHAFSDLGRAHDRAARRRAQKARRKLIRLPGEN